ncbi:MAG: NUDIX domain-containing protein, partial [Planctomycetota bacterium]|nr:NUDIX domain-containing protein [Planctomycetota bacterium]
EQVLAQWSGLGYYSRARSLHRAAQAIVEEHNGQFPPDHAQALALPGVGEYTAGAVLSIAYGLPEALVDGNVERVFTRVFGLRAASGSAPLRKHSWTLARLCMESSAPGDWNQALMELGATVCTPGQPRCEECPWSRSCVAKGRGEQAMYPSPKQRKKTVDLPIEAICVQDSGRLLLLQRPPKGSMAGLWELPTLQPATSGATSIWADRWPDGLGAKGQSPLMQAKHAITHHRIVMTVRAGTMAKSDRIGDSRLAWFGWDELEDLALTGLTRKAVAHLAP